MTRKKYMIAVFAMAAAWLAWGCKAQPAKEAVPAKEAAPLQNKTGLIVLAPESQQLAEIVVEEAAFRTLKRQMEFPGTIQVNENRLAHVGSRITGRVIEVDAGLGDHVEPGKKLAVIDSPDLGKAQSEYITARAKFVVAEKAFERARALLEGKVIGTGEFQRREGDYLTAKSEAQAARGRLYLLGMTEMEVKNLGAEHSTRSQVAITTTLGGTVIERHATLGDVVEPAKTLFTVADLSTLWGIAEVPEQDISKVKKGLSVEVSAFSYPGEIYSGKITYIAETIDPSSRTVKARVEVDNSSGKLKPKMFATFRIILQETEMVLTIPKTAVQREGEKTIVFVEKEKGSFEKKAVQTGPEASGYYPVLSGLAEGDKVVTRGAFILKSEILKGSMGNR